MSEKCRFDHLGFRGHELLFCKKDVYEATHAKGLAPHLEKRKAAQAVEFSRHHLQKNQGRTKSREGKKGSRPAIPCTPWFLEPQKQGEGLEGGTIRVTPIPLGTLVPLVPQMCVTWHAPQPEVRQNSASGGTSKLLSAFEQHPPPGLQCSASFEK